jgi:hypothetical protein
LQTKASRTSPDCYVASRFEMVILFKSSWMRVNRCGFRSPNDLGEMVAARPRSTGIVPESALR